MSARRVGSDILCRLIAGKLVLKLNFNKSSGGVFVTL